MESRTTALGTAPLGPLLVRLSIPGMVGMVVSSLYNLVDTFWVSGLPNGTQAIAALTVLFPVQMIAGALGFGLNAGVTSLVSRRFGEARAEEVHRAAGNVVTLSLLLGTAVAVVVIPLARPVVVLFGATADTVDPAVAYLRVVAFGFPCQLLSLAANGLYRGSGNTFVPMVLLMSGAVVNAALAPFLIYGWGPFPRLGIAGAGLATLIAQTISAAASAWYLHSGRSGYHLRAPHFRLSTRILLDIAQVGAPVTAESFLRSLVASATNWVLAGFGPAAVAAQGLSWRVMMLLIAFLGGGVNQALVPTVGYCFGAHDYRRLWRAYRIAAIWTGSGGLLLGAVLFAFAPPIVSLFTRDPELSRLGVLALRLRISTFFLVEPQMMAVFTFQGMGMGGRAMVLTLTRNAVVVLPLTFLLAAWGGVAWVYAAQPLSDVLCLVVAAAMVVRVYRQYPPGAPAKAPTTSADDLRGSR